MIGAEARREARLPIESIILPFLGSRAADFLPFEYVLQDVSVSGVKISIPDWVVGRARINRGERINLHVPFEIRGRVLYSGEAAWQAPDEGTLGQILGVAMDQGKPLNYPVYFSVDSRQLAIDITAFEARRALLAKLAKDALLLKRGCLIYLRHLSTFFSRLTDLTTEEYEHFRDFVFGDIMAKTRLNAEFIESFHAMIVNHPGSFKDICADVDLSQLRQAVEPEMYVQLFTEVYKDTFALQYLYAIKELENKLYISYNTLVLVYCSTL